MCFYLEKGKEGCKKGNCEFYHPKMCKFEKNCNNQNCRRLHPKPKDKRKNKKEENDNEVEVIVREDKKETSKPNDNPNPNPKAKKVVKENEDFQKDKIIQDTSQVEMRNLLEELSRNVQILMQDRAVMKSWGWLDQTQYYHPQQ